MAERRNSTELLALLALVVILALAPLLLSTEPDVITVETRDSTGSHTTCTVVPPDLEACR